jgi:ubiquinone/menaquinone biosynthesis C-methylase UbiE
MNAEILDSRRRPQAGLLNDTPARDYSGKLSKFNAFAQPELQALIRGLKLRPGMHVLDMGCGTGEALNWLSAEIAETGRAVGVDLAAAHVSAARRHAARGVEIYQADLYDVLFAPASFDLVWCVNTLNHLSDRIGGLKHLASLLRSGGRIAVGQSSLLPDMYLAWDARLERVTNEAVHQYYRDRYGLNERDLTSVRSLVGTLRCAPLRNVTVRSVLIERFSPLDGASETYLRDAIFRDTWGERLRPYLNPGDFDELTALCDPAQPSYALHRPDFHFLQTFTLATGEIVS